MEWYTRGMTTSHQSYRDDLLSTFPQELRKRIEVFASSKSRGYTFMAKKTACIAEVRDTYHLPWLDIGILFSYSEHSTPLILYRRFKGLGTRKYTKYRDPVRSKEWHEKKDKELQYIKEHARAGEFLSDIGKHLGMSRQAAYARLKRYDAEAISVGKEVRKNNLIAKNTKKCPACGKDFYPYNKRIAFCSRECYRKTRCLTPEERKERTAMRWKRFTEIHKKKLKTDKKYRARFLKRQLEYHSMWFNRKMQDPEWADSYRKGRNAYYKKRYATDPAFRKMMAKKAHRNHLKRKLNK